MREIFRFCLSILFFLIVFSTLYIGKTMKDLRNYKTTLPGHEIYNAIGKSKKKTDKKKLIIGDSTGHQFFNNYFDDDSIYSLACNQAVGMCGHFFLLDDFLKSGNRPKSIYMIFNALFLSNNLDQNFTYHYFLKPFYNDDYKERMSETVIKQIKKIPSYKISQIPRIRTTKWAPKYYPCKEFYLLSPISNEYLLKIDSLRNIYGFDLYLIPSPVPKTKKKEIEDLVKQNFNEVDSRLRELLHRYVDGITYMDDSCFFDGTHLRNPLLYRNIIEDKMGNECYRMKVH